MSEYYIFYLIIDGETKEVVKLRFLGKAGQNQWLHFQNVKTKENHLCNPEQFPLHTMRGRGRSLTFRYEEDSLPPVQQRQRPLQGFV